MLGKTFTILITLVVLAGCKTQTAPAEQENDADNSGEFGRTPFSSNDSSFDNNGDSFGGSSCSTWSDPQQCQSSGCQWDQFTSQCSTSVAGGVGGNCQQFSSQVICQQSPGCFWQANGFNGLCRSNNGSAGGFGQCDQFFRAAQCQQAQLQGCYWDTLQQRCLMGQGAGGNSVCRQFFDLRQCQDASLQGCYWDIASQSCFGGQSGGSNFCAQIRGFGQCQQAFAQGCRWDQQFNSCISGNTNCQQIRDQLQCLQAQRQGCRWENSLLGGRCVNQF